ncbi:MAG: hypothetical protein EP329_27010 [Deltaproteobacteria bacterium]|nr:MAG: hypothetical protein EP329_27010 [Deltaproteobacteria bacterium]
MQPSPLAVLGILAAVGGWLAGCGDGKGGDDTADTCTGAACTPGDTTTTEDDVANGDGVSPGDTTAADTVAEPTLCEVRAAEGSHEGCEHWAVDLDVPFAPGPGGGWWDWPSEPYGVLVTNPAHNPGPATVGVSTASESLVSRTIAPGDWAELVLPPCGDGASCADAVRAVNGTVRVRAAYRLTSDLPVVAYQLNPLEPESPAVIDGVERDDYMGGLSDGSLLLPTHALGTRYRVLAWPSGADTMRSFLTVVGTSDEPTTVTVTPSFATMQGLDQVDGGEIGAIAAGAATSFVLQAHDVLNLEVVIASGEDIPDLTGSLVTADRPVAVFAGAEGATAPITEPLTCCLDHVEHQLLPTAAWGTTHFAGRAWPRNGARDVWRVVADSDDTQVTLDPDLLGGAVVLDAGDWVDVVTVEHLRISSSAPVSVGQFLTGMYDPASSGGLFTEDSAMTGDPSFIVTLPTDRYRADYAFVIPAGYDQSYATVVLPGDAGVTLDGAVLDEAEVTLRGGLDDALPGGSHRALRVPVEPGAHTLEATAPCGVTVYGFLALPTYQGNGASFGYTAGAALPPPE